LSGLPFPVHFALGNHDERATFREVFPQAPFTGDYLQYVIDSPVLRLIVLDTLEEGRHGGAFCEERAAWLAARLDEDTAKPTLIVQHHPPIEAGIPWMNTDAAEPWVERLASCLRGRDNVTGLVCGHIHRASATRWEHVIVATCPSTAPQVALDLRPIDPDVPDQRNLIVADPPAYALHWWNGRELVTHWDTAEDRLVLARYDADLQQMIQHMLAERPDAGLAGAGWRRRNSRSAHPGERLLAAALHRTAQPDRLAILGDRAAGEIEAALLQQIDQRIVGQDRLGILGVDQLPDRGLHRFGRYRAFAIGRSHARGEEVLQLERAAIAVQVLVRGHAADGRFVHRDGFATARSVSGRRCETPWRKNPSCCFTISAATFRIVFCRWSSAFSSQLASASFSPSQPRASLLTQAPRIST
jgi:hypothetical protein